MMHSVALGVYIVELSGKLLGMLDEKNYLIQRLNNTGLCKKLKGRQILDQEGQAITPQPQTGSHVHTHVELPFESVRAVNWGVGGCWGEGPELRCRGGAC